ncbi:PQQ-dependent sugar dehydrogenase [Myxococcus virescens]|uniref:PQQ-dependent sugar dehydrogenase n=1 Tax=Myxococcus virescens TaxID=83456 RepID=UPI003DA4DDCD
MRSTLMLLGLLGLSSPTWAVVPSGFVETHFTSNTLTQAMGMAWAPDGSGRLFITLKTGEIRVVSLKDGQPEMQPGNSTLVTQVFATEEQFVYADSECGLIGIAFDPNYVVNRYVYFFVTVSASEQQIVRYTDADGTGTARTVIVSRLPTRGANNDGGAIGFGPDGKLYWAIGDLGNGTGVNADLTSMAAKVSRANPDGTPASDNPFNDGVGPNNEYIWARGLRNPFTFTFQPTTGRLWVNSAGTDYEQVFVVTRRSHAGYSDYENNQPSTNDFITPVVKYRTNGADTRNLAAGGAMRGSGVATFTTTGSHGFRKGERLTLSGVEDASFNGLLRVASVPSPTTFTVAQPSLPDAASSGGTATTQELGGSITGGTFYDATLFDEAYQDNFFFGDFNTGQLTRVTLEEDHSVATVDEWATGFTSQVDMSVGPDGALYTIGASGGVLRRITPATPGQKLVVSGLQPRVEEGGRAAFTVRLAEAPASDVSVQVSQALGGSEDLSIVSGAALTFTASNWSVPQVVTLTAAVDEDTTPDVATFMVVADGLREVAVVATSIDNNSPRLVLTESQVTVVEGGTATFGVSLSQRPPRSVTVTVARTRGDEDLTVQSGATLSFTTSDWNTPKDVTLTAAPDADGEDGTAIITVAAPGVDARAVEAFEQDTTPLPPVILSEPVTRAVVGSPYRYAVQATARPAPTYALVSTVPGMSIDAATGVLTWEPTETGTVEVSVRVSNGAAPDAVQDFTITVSPDAPPTARLTRPENGERVSGTTAEFYGDCHDDVGCTHAEFYVDDVLRYTDERTESPYSYGGEPSRWDTTGLTPGWHRVRFVVVDSTGQQGSAEATVCVGDVPCESPPSNGGTDAGTDAGTEPPPFNEPGGCNCNAMPLAPLAWGSLAWLVLQRRRSRRS